MIRGIRTTEIALCLLLGFFLAVPDAKAQSISGRDALSAVNQYRQSRVLPKHLFEPRLMQAAEKLAIGIAQQGSTRNWERKLRLELEAAGYPSREYRAFVHHNHRTAREFARALSPDLLQSSKSMEAGIAVLDQSYRHMPRGTQSIWVAIFAKHDTIASRNWRREIVKYVNKFRREHRLPPLRLNDRLNKAAQYHADDMAVRDYFEHYSPRGKGPGDRAAEFSYRYYKVLENLAAGMNSAEEAVEGWKASKDGHREAMLDADITEVGVGYRYMPNDKGRTRLSHYWAMTMGVPIN